MGCSDHLVDLQINSIICDTFICLTCNFLYMPWNRLKILFCNINFSLSNYVDQVVLYENVICTKCSCKTSNAIVFTYFVESLYAVKWCVIYMYMFLQSLFQKLAKVYTAKCWDISLEPPISKKSGWTVLIKLLLNTSYIPVIF